MSRVRTAVSCVLALICVAGIGYSGFKIIEWKLDSDKTIEQTETIEEKSEIVEIEETEKVETIGTNEPPNTPYWNYIKMKLIDVDFTELKKINSETTGWVQVSGTNINYPFVSTSNNDFYLNHSFDKSYSKAGWVFADFRNHVDGTDRNLILYAHGRYDATMFGTLRNILTSGWLNNSENFTVRTVNASESALWQVFSVYKIPTTNDYIQTAFANDEEFGRFAEILRSRSTYDFKTTVAPTDNILTLSTCFSSTERVVLHAKLIKRMNRDGTAITTPAANAPAEETKPVEAPTTPEMPAVDSSTEQETTE